jgi:hypothetical protein
MIKRRVLAISIYALLLMMGTAACGARTPAPPPAGLNIPPATPTPALQQGMVSAFLTQIVPATGASGAQVVGQFCVDQTAQAVALLPAGTSYQVLPLDLGGPASNASCDVIGQENGSQVLLCQGAPGSQFVLYYCLANACNQLIVDLSCSAAPGQSSGTTSSPPRSSPSYSGQDPLPQPTPISDQKTKPTQKPKPTAKPHPTQSANQH